MGRIYTKWEILKMKFAFKLGNIKLWLGLQKRLLQLWWADAPKYKAHLEKGAYHFRKGAIYQVGQPFHIPNTRTGKEELYYIKNLYYNFRLGSITHRLSKSPIPESELFVGKPTKILTKIAKDS